MAIKSADQITIIDVTDAYSVMLTSEAYTFVGGTNGTATGLTCTTEAVAFCGTNQCASVSVTAASIICPEGISATVANSGTSAVKVTFTTTAAITEACEATIPVVVDGITVNKKFSFAVAMKGNTGATGQTGATGSPGKGITGVETYYLASPNASGVTTGTSGWTTAMQSTTTTNKYLWSYQKISYTTGSPTTTTPVIIGTHGATGATGQTGATGNGISKVETFYLTTSASSGVTTSTNGWSTTPTATTTTNKYIWSYQKTTYTNGQTASSTPAIIGTHGATGAQGAAGADAITVTITSSNGTIFKNNSGSTVLTAHVFKGAIEQSITDEGVCGSLGSIKWYKQGSTTAIKTSKTLSVSASDVTNSVVYTAQLEQ